MKLPFNFINPAKKKKKKTLLTLLVLRYRLCGFLHFLLFCPCCHLLHLILKMAASMQLNVKPLKAPFNLKPTSKHAPKAARIRCAAATPSKRYNITLLPGDGIGPEVISVAKNVLNLIASLEGSV